MYVRPVLDIYSNIEVYLEERLMKTEMQVWYVSQW